MQLYFNKSINKGREPSIQKSQVFILVFLFAITILRARCEIHWWQLIYAFQHNHTLQMATVNAGGKGEEEEKKEVKLVASNICLCLVLCST